MRMGSCLAMASTKSKVVAPLARDLLDHQAGQRADGRLVGVDLRRLKGLLTRRR